MLGLFAVVLVRTAWVSDDAYITFRTVDNFLAGYGLRWNVGERVQTYTHPLWMFLVSGATAVLREPYYASLALAFVCTMLALTLFARRVASSVPIAMVGLTILLFSQAFVDFSTSGLENPLVHLLLIAFVLKYWSFDSSAWDVGVLAGIAGLVMLTRLDAGLIVLPALCEAAFRNLRGSASPWPADADDYGAAHWIRARCGVGAVLAFLLWLSLSEYRVCQAQDRNSCVRARSPGHPLPAGFLRSRSDYADGHRCRHRAVALCRPTCGLDACRRDCFAPRVRGAYRWGLHERAVPDSCFDGLRLPAGPFWSSPVARLVAAGDGWSDRCGLPVAASSAFHRGRVWGGHMAANLQGGNRR